MKKKLWYAVKSGRKTGLFTSWDDCKLQVIGYPGASYKGFFTKEEAMEFLGDVTDKKVKALKDELRVAVYVDGSYIPTIPDTFSFGVVLSTMELLKLMQRKLLMQKKRRCGMWREKYMVQCLRWENVWKKGSRR